MLAYVPAPIQKPNLEVWRPSEKTPSNAVWEEKTIPKSNDVDDVAICLSVTHDIYADVNEFLSSPDIPPVNCIVMLTPIGGPSPQSVHGADHAYQLAAQLPRILAHARPNRLTRAHIFFACPNALMFFIGQQRDSLGRLVLYEFDFGLERDGSYQKSLSFPNATSHSDSANEVPYDS